MQSGRKSGIELAVMSERNVDEIWAKASVVTGYSPDRWRKDFAGAWIQRDQFGLSSEYGWDVCHLIPVSHGGTNDLDNLCAIHWENHRRKSNQFPVFKTAVTAEGDKNIHEERIWRIGK